MEHDQTAFPVDDFQHCENPGMTLRDYFAANSLIGIRSTGMGISSSDVASLAYSDANALLAERQK